MSGDAGGVWLIPVLLIAAKRPGCVSKVELHAAALRPVL